MYVQNKIYKVTLPPGPIFLGTQFVVPVYGSGDNGYFLTSFSFNIEVSNNMNISNAACDLNWICNSSWSAQLHYTISRMSKYASSVLPISKQPAQRLALITVLVNSGTTGSVSATLLKFDTIFEPVYFGLVRSQAGFIVDRGGQFFGSGMVFFLDNNSNIPHVISAFASQHELINKEKLNNIRVVSNISVWTLTYMVWNLSDLLLQLRTIWTERKC